MSKKELIKRLQKKNPEINQSDIENIVNIFFKNIFGILSNENSLEIRGLGRWFSKTLKENHNARNPLTNELIYKPERKKIRFKASKKLNKIINE